MATIGFIGLGRMGRPMASNLCKAGFELLVHDVDPDPVAVLTGLGARAAADPAEVARSAEIVITMLPSSIEVEAVALGSGGLLENGARGLLVMDMSTVEPRTTALIDEAAGARGMSLVDAPVGRLAAHAGVGRSLFMVGASAADFERVRPLLEAMGSTIHHCGPVGSGIKTKLVNNYLAIISCQLNAEALALSQGFGLDLGKTLDVIFGTSAVNGQLRLNWLNKSLAGDSAPGFTIDLAHKDLSVILAAAQEEKVPLPVAAAAREMFTLARGGAHAKSDFSCMVDSHCDLAGLERPRLPDGWTPPRGA